MEESEVLDQSFQLIFAFDEIVALGYRESVNLAQIRTFTEMDSHEEKVYLAVRQVEEHPTISFNTKIVKDGLVESFILHLFRGIFVKYVACIVFIS